MLGCTKWEVSLVFENYEKVSSVEKDLPPIEYNDKQWWFPVHSFMPHLCKQQGKGLKLKVTYPSPPLPPPGSLQGKNLWNIKHHSDAILHNSAALANGCDMRCHWSIRKWAGLTGSVYWTIVGPIGQTFEVYDYVLEKKKHQTKQTNNRKSGITLDLLHSSLN